MVTVSELDELATLLVVREKAILQQEPATSVALDVVGPFHQLTFAHVGNYLHRRHSDACRVVAELSSRNCLHS